MTTTSTTELARYAGTTTELFTGLGRRERRRLLRRWKEEGAGLSLKQWAQQNDLVGDAAQAWLAAKRGTL
jgi:hypothetical protein